MEPFRATLTKVATTAKAAFVVMYYGRWPWYWRLWAESVAANPGLDFLLITDLPAPAPLPPNVKLVPMTLAQALERFSACFGTAVTSVAPHKLCDYRPFYGLVFADLLQSYAYWGYCDVDLIFGDLSPLTALIREERYDFISPWKCTAGHCSLIRNVERCNRVGLSIDRWAQRIHDPKSTHMDEGAVVETAAQTGTYAFALADEVPTEWLRSEPFLGASVTPGGKLAGAPWTVPFLVQIEQGKVRVIAPDGASHEVLYFHFMAMKERRFWKQLPEAGHWTPCSITPCGYEAGLRSRKHANTWWFRVRCWIAQSPQLLFPWLNRLLPKLLLKLIVCVYKRRVS